GEGGAASAPGAMRPPPGLPPRRCLGRGRLRGHIVPGVGEQVPGAGGQLAGDGGGGDLLPAPLRDALDGGGELRGALGGLRRPAPSAATPSPPRGCARSRRPRSLPRTVGVSPAQDASWRAEANRRMSPASARITSAVNGPTPGSWVKIFTRGSDRARWWISPSSRPI